MRKRDAARHPLNGQIARRAVDCVWRRTGLETARLAGICVAFPILYNSILILLRASVSPW